LIDESEVVGTRYNVWPSARLLCIDHDSIVIA
jgi:hypothetical protein